LICSGCDCGSCKDSKRGNVASFHQLGGRVPTDTLPRKGKVNSLNRHLNLIPRSTLARTTNLTIPDSDTFVPEFGINIPPHLALQFRSLLADDNPANEEKEPTPPGPNLSSPLGTPLPHNPDFSLHGYDIGGGSSFSIDYDDDGGFGYAGGYDDDDDVLRHANDAGTLDFNLEIPGSSTKKRGANDEGGSGKRARYHSIDDEDVRRIAREDHAGGGQFDFALSGGIEFGDDPQFDPYHTPSPISPENGPEKAGQVVPTLPLIKKGRRALIVQDSVTVNTDSPRAWQDRYAEKMHGAKARWEKAERAKVAAARAMDALWRWNGTTELHPLLATFFSRDALLKRWDQSPSEVKRKWDATIGGGDIEIGMDSGGFGDGGFGDMPGIPDSLDLTVVPPLPPFSSHGRFRCVGDGNRPSCSFNRTRTRINPIPPNALAKHFFPPDIPSTLSRPPTTSFH